MVGAVTAGVPAAAVVCGAGEVGVSEAHPEAAANRTPRHARS